jgi:hypothetical protein
LYMLVWLRGKNCAGLARLDESQLIKKGSLAKFVYKFGYLTHELCYLND